jgi:hypothetical protein
MHQILFRHTPATQNKPTHKTQILTYNVWIAPLVRWAPAENLDKICDFVRAQGADVVCMQEVCWRVGVGVCVEVLGGGGGGGGSGGRVCVCVCAGVCVCSCNYKGDGSIERVRAWCV